MLAKRWLDANVSNGSSHTEHHLSSEASNKHPTDSTFNFNSL